MPLSPICRDIVKASRATDAVRKKRACRRLGTDAVTASGVSTAWDMGRSIPAEGLLPKGAKTTNRDRYPAVSSFSRLISMRRRPWSRLLKLNTSRGNDANAGSSRSARRALLTRKLPEAAMSAN